MKQNFSEFFEIIKNKFILNHGGKDSLNALSEFLGHGHKGKVTAWSKGQWPSNQDCWVLHKKMGLNLEWLLTGKGEMFIDDVQRSNDDSTEVVELLRENQRLHRELEILLKNENAALKRDSSERNFNATIAPGAGSVAHSSRGGTE